MNVYNSTENAMIISTNIENYTFILCRKKYKWDNNEGSAGKMFDFGCILIKSLEFYTYFQFHQHIYNVIHISSVSCQKGRICHA